MRTVLLVLAALAACVIDDDRKAGPAATAPAPDTAEWFLTEYGFRIPLKDTADFLNCGDWLRESARRPAGYPVGSTGLEYLIEKCLPLSAVPPEGLKLCKDPGHQAPASPPRPPPSLFYKVDPEYRPTPIGRGGWGYHCPDAPKGTLVRVVTAADLAWIRSTRSQNTLNVHRDDPDREALAALRQGTRVR